MHSRLPSRSSLAAAEFIRVQGEAGRAYWTTKAGINMRLVVGVGPVGSKFVPDQNYRFDRIANTGLYDDASAASAAQATLTSASRLWTATASMPKLFFGILGVASRVRDHEAAYGMLRIYIDWLTVFCSRHPDGQIELACPPYGDIEAAAKEVNRVTKLGAKGLELSKLLRHGASVAPSLGAIVESGQRRAIAAAFPRRRTDAGERAPREGDLRRKQFTSVTAFQNEPGQHHRCGDWCRGAGAPAEFAHRLWRDRHTLATLCARPHVFPI